MKFCYETEVTSKRLYSTPDFEIRERSCISKYGNQADAVMFLICRKDVCNMMISERLNLSELIKKGLYNTKRENKNNTILKTPIKI